MDYDFQANSETLQIPTNVYRPVKRCPYCLSVFITEKSCEACGRSMLYHPVGKPFSSKSFYGIKERYLENFSKPLSIFPVFEDKQSPQAQSYSRNLSKRFSDLITAFNTPDAIDQLDRKLFYIEAM